MLPIRSETYLTLIGLSFLSIVSSFSSFSKYCECYAGNVKCSASCRCMGCKNMGATYHQGPGRDAEGNLILATDSAESPQASPRESKQQEHLHQQSNNAPLAPNGPESASHHSQQHSANHYPYSVPSQAHHHHYPPPHHPHAHHHPLSYGHTHPSSSSAASPARRRSSTASNGEPWLAAQNLTSLKRGSPSSSEPSEGSHKKQRLPEKRRPSQDNGSMSMPPSLASSSGETFGTSSPGGFLSRRISSSDTQDSRHRHDHRHNAASAHPATGKSRIGAGNGRQSTSPSAGVSSLLMAAYAMTEFAEEGAARKNSASKKPKSDSKKDKKKKASSSSPKAQRRSPPALEGAI